MPSSGPGSRDTSRVRRRSSKSKHRPANKDEGTVQSTLGAAASTVPQGLTTSDVPSTVPCARPHNGSDINVQSKVISNIVVPDENAASTSVPSKSSARPAPDHGAIMPYTRAHNGSDMDVQSNVISNIIVPDENVASTSVPSKSSTRPAPDHGAIMPYTRPHNGSDIHVQSKVISNIIVPDENAASTSVPSKSSTKPAPDHGAIMPCARPQNASDIHVQSKVVSNIVVPDENAASTSLPSKSSTRPAPDDGASRVSKKLFKPSSVEEAAALNRLQAMSVSPPGRNTAKQGTFKRTAAIIFLLFATTIVAIIVATIVFYLAHEKTRHDLIPPICATKACLDHSLGLGLKLHNSQEACKDFGQFVCSRWLHNDTRYSEPTAIFRLAYWLRERTKLREDPSRPVTKGVRQMMNACLRFEGTIADIDDSESIVEFMSKELFPWLLDSNDARLGDPNDYSVPLRALVNLAALWVTPLWFSVELIEPWHGTAQRRSVSMSPSVIPYILDAINTEIIRYDFYKTVVNLFLSGTFRERALPAFIEFAMASVEIQRSICGNLSLTFTETHPKPRFLVIRQFPALVSKLQARDWVDAFQSAFNVKPELTEEDTLVATDGKLLAVMRVLFESYSAREVTFHTAWWFIQLLGPIVSSSVQDLFSKHPLSAYYYPIACRINAVNVYTLLFSGTDDRELSKDHRLIVKLLSNVHMTALAEIRSWSTLDTKAIHAVSTRLQNTSTMIRPPQEYMTNRRLEVLYGNDHGTAQSFFEHWRKSGEQLQKSLGSEEYQASLRLFRFQSAHLASYNPVTNVISIAVAALAAPYYSNEGTDAMVYGGLGFLYAMQLARTINALTILLSDDMSHTPWTPSLDTVNTDKESTQNIGSPGRALWELARCSSNVTSGSNVTALFPFLPALKIAHAAYLRFRSDDRELRLPGMEEYSAEQVFFITACHVTCREMSLRRRVSPECTEAVRNYEPFAKAFSCPSGSSMNPEQKCAFL